MKLVSAKCPDCGASIQLDSRRIDSYCSYCGNKILVQHAISLIQIDNSHNLQNYLNLGQNALDGQNHQEAYDYANKILEIDSKNSQAWLLKMRAIVFLGTLEDLRTNEIITCGRNVIEYSDDPEIRHIVYASFLLKANGVLGNCIALISNTAEIRQVHMVNRSINLLTANNQTYIVDLPFMELVETCVNSALELKFAIPLKEIENNEDYIWSVVTLANSYIQYSFEFKERYNIYGVKLLDEAITFRRSILKKLKRGLPENEKQKLSEERIAKAPAGCYIATAVYGSYYAPEVIVLRQFRDNILAKSLWGRIFINIYYRVSPPVANYLKNLKYVNAGVKKLLDKWVLYLERE